MADIRCPMCSKPNPEELEACVFCGARLKPLTAPPPEGARPIRPGEQPVKKDTAEFEKTTLPPGDKEPIHPGEAPTKKNTAELEQALPSWLRSLRAGQGGPPSGSTPEPASDQGLPPEFEKAPAPEPSSGGMPDWLAGLGLGSAEKEDEVPDWLASLRETGGAGIALPPEPGTRPLPEVKLPREETPPPGPEDRLAAGQGFAEGFPPAGREVQPASPKPPAVERPSAEQKPEPAPRAVFPDWLQKLQSESAPPEEAKPAAPPAGEGTPAWLSNLPNIPPANQAAPFPSQPSEKLPDWLNNLKDFEATSESAQPPTGSEQPIPDWLASAATESEAPQAAPTEELPDWLSKLETQAAPGSAAPSTPGRGKEPPPVPSGKSLETPDWLSKLQSDVAEAAKAETGKEEFEAASEPLPEQKPSSLPGWLSAIEPAPAAPAETPALIIGPEETASGEVSESAFAMEMPDWISKLTPEQGAEGAAPGEEEKTSGAIEPAELPSWVQAMRPVESVISEPKVLPLEAGKVTEERGPLAGLQGVLPAAPGLGPLRKPPAYSTRLQMTESQERYAAQMEKLVTDEATSHVGAPKRPISTRLLRWLIAGLLLLASALPVVTGMQIAPSSALYPPEMVTTFTLVSSLPTNAPVLIAYDYEPALSGELEAAAAPLIDHLLFSGARLTFVSTSPTGPALAERFLRGTQAEHNYQDGQQYINLGYLAGGPAGVLYFATQPAEAAPFTVGGMPAWQTPPLQGVQKLSDFSAVLVLTDSADSARLWIEQAGPSLGSTPMLMVISAQAEPMIRPYYDAGQIKGLVTGLAGGKAYEQAIQHPGLGQTYWNAFSAGLLVAEMLIVVGALWNALAAMRARRSRPGVEA